MVRSIFRSISRPCDSDTRTVGVWGATSYRPAKIDEHRVCWNLSGLIWFDRQCGKPRLTPLFMSEKRSVFFFGPLSPLSHYMSLLPSKADRGEKSSGTSMAMVLFGPDSRTTSQDATVISSLDTVFGTQNQRAKGPVLSIPSKAVRTAPVSIGILHWHPSYEVEIEGHLG